MSVTCIVYLAAFGTVIASAVGRCPIWVPVLLLCVAGLLGCFAH